MEVEIAFLLVIADTGLEGFVALVGIQYPTQFVDARLRHALGRQAAGHAFERLADLVKLDQFLVAERNHPGSHMGNPDQQFLPFQAMDGFTQRTAADAVDTRQFGLGNLAARGDLTLHDRRLDASEHMLGERFGIVWNSQQRGWCLKHIVDNQCFRCTEIRLDKPFCQTNLSDCRQSSNTHASPHLFRGRGAESADTGNPC